MGEGGKCMPDRLHLPNLAEKTPNPTTYRSLDPHTPKPVPGGVAWMQCDLFPCALLFPTQYNLSDPLASLPSSLFFMCVCFS